MITNKDGTKTITISAEAAALLFFTACNTSGSPTNSARKFSDEVAMAIVGKYDYDLWETPAFKTLREIVEVFEMGNVPTQKIKDFGIAAGIIEKPKVVIPAIPIKLRMPDGKFAKANYQVVKYPLHGVGNYATRHIQLGKIEGDNVKVLEWDGNKGWLPKTYKLSKIRG